MYPLLVVKNMTFIMTQGDKSQKMDLFTVHDLYHYAGEGITFFLHMKKIKALKTPADSAVTMTEVVFPNDTNPLGILRGGKILDWMDTASAICAQTHANRIAVTASIDQVSFRKPAKLGDIITLKACVTRAFHTSMEVYVEAWARRIPHGDHFLCNESYYTFVALDEHARPVEVEGLAPVTESEKKKYAEAKGRYDYRAMMKKKKGEQG
jgi:acyl-CoA hydrolase